MQTRHIGKLSSISEVLSNKNPDKKTSSLFKCIQLHKNWTKIVGSKWENTAKPVGYHHKCLTIRVPSACHIQEMSFDKEILMKKINKLLGPDFIQDIRWTS